MKKIISIALALISGICSAQTFKVQDLSVLGTATLTGLASFSVRPVFNGNTPWDSGNFNPSSYATLASPTFTGVPAAPTAAAGTNTTQLATTAFVQTAASNPKTPLTVGTSLYPSIGLPITTTASTTNGSTSIIVSSAAGITTGMGVYGANLPACSQAAAAFVHPYVVSIAGTTLTLSCPANSTAGGVSVQFGQPRWDSNSTLLVNDIGVQTLKVGASAQGNSASWLDQISAGQDFRFTSAAQIITPPGGGFALTLGGRSSDATGGAIALPLQVLFYADNWTSNVGGETAYFQSNLSAATGGSTPHIQFEQSINSLWTTTGENPYAINQNNTTTAHRLDCGTGNIGALPNNCGQAIDIVPNPMAFETGIMIADGAIDTGGGTRQGAVIAMPLMTGFTWYSASNTFSAAIYSPSAGIARYDVPSNGQHQFFVNNVEQFAVGSGFTYQKPVTFATVSSITCNAGNEGFAASITDSTTATFGATVTGGGANHVAARCNGSNWVVY